jgi:hypothetical protein
MPGLVDNGLARGLMNIYESLLGELTSADEFKALRAEQIVTFGFLTFSHYFPESCITKPVLIFPCLVCWSCSGCKQPQKV